MTIAPKSQFFIFGGGVAVVVIGTVVAILMYWSPNLQADRKTLAQTRAAIAAIERQQKNLAGATQQLTALQGEQAKLNEDVWSFSHEDAFYDLWESLATSTNTDIALETIADASPGELPVRRDATITVIGSVTNVWRALQAITAIEPVVVIQNLELAPGGTSGTVLAEVTVSTLWYDDTLR